MDEHDRVLADRSPEEIAAYLREIGDDEAAARLERQIALPQGQSIEAMLHRTRYLRNGLVVGFVSDAGNGQHDIVDARGIEPETTLKDKRVKITLDQFFVHEYPGIGKHRILCEFAGQNQIADKIEELKFTLMVEVADREGTSIIGKPIFMGLTIGDDGINFRGRTVNVGSRTDDMILDAINGEAFKGGLALATTLQPALKPFVGLATHVVKAAVKRARNAPVFNFDIGLDFNSQNLAARLRRGSYVVVQTGEAEWDWSRFRFASQTRHVIKKSDGLPLEANYFVIGIDDFAGEPAKHKGRSATKAGGSQAARTRP